LIQWLITWVILAVVFFVAAESIQRYLYESSVEKIAWRVMGVTPWLAAALVGLPLPFDQLIFNFTYTVVHATLWFLACWLALRFQWQHAAAAGLIAVVTIAPITSSSVESLMQKRAAASTPTKTTTATPAANPSGSNPQTSK
jgi:uncharacterized membrane protein YvlD (DUF360 family)